MLERAPAPGRGEAVRGAVNWAVGTKWMLDLRCRASARRLHPKKAAVRQALKGAFFVGVSLRDCIAITANDSRH